MKHICRLLLSVVFAIVISASSLVSDSKSNTDFTRFVNPFIGTDFHGHTFPGACAPFGMLQLSPDTRLDTWDGCSGYHYSDSVIIGFTHTHLSGTGCLDYGDLLIMPVIGYSNTVISRDRYSSTFSHKNEHSSAGYYSVTLDNGQINAELTTGRRAAMHRYTFPDGVDPQIIIDLDHRDKLLEYTLESDGRSIVKGLRRSTCWAEDQSFYFYIEFSGNFIDSRIDGDKAIFTFKGEKRKNCKNGVVIKVGASSVSTENAKLNLYSELDYDDWDFDLLKQKCISLWNDYLGKIEIGSASLNIIDSLELKKLTTFYTALYHTAVHPNLYSDINGEYRGMDRNVHRSDREQYSVFSLWDTFRSLHPLLALIERERTLDFINSFLSIYDECGKLPVWELARNETNCMIGYNSVSVIADAAAKGIVFDYNRALEAMIASSLKKEYGIDVFHENGVVLADMEHESVSKTLEYAYDDWCIAQVALKTGNDFIYNKYIRSAHYYLNVFDPQTGFMRPRLDGMWLTPFEPREVNNHFTEANSWQYSFFVPQDIETHIMLLGGDDSYISKLDSLFSAPEKTVGRTQSDITGQIGQYAHGNEPSHHISYLYAYAGKPWKTQKIVRKIMDELYSDSPDGLCGNEDCGQMSAWYVLSAAGIYPVCPGSEEFVFGSPLFNDIKIRLENGNVFRICTDSGSGSKFIDSASLNGKLYLKSYINYKDILDGKTLTFKMRDTPNLNFGVSLDERPHSKLSQDYGFVSNPWFVANNNIFPDSLEVSIAGFDDINDMIMYRAGDVNTVSDNQFIPYEGPVMIYDSMEFEAYSENRSGGRSFTSKASFHKITNDYSIEIVSNYNPQYTAGGDEGLIDGVRGSVNWRTGGWQGYQDQDFEAIIDLGEEKSISTVGCGFCQDLRSWILMPVKVDYYVSSDNINYTLIAELKNDSIKEDDYTLLTHDFIFTSEPNSSDLTYGRYVKVKAENYGELPAWHLGAGGKAFIFVDEFWVK